MSLLENNFVFDKVDVEKVTVNFAKLITLEQKEPKINPESAIEPDFVSIKSRESKKERKTGTRGEKVDWSVLN